MRRFSDPAGLIVITGLKAGVRTMGDTAGSSYVSVLKHGVTAGHLDNSVCHITSLRVGDRWKSAWKRSYPAFILYILVLTILTAQEVTLTMNCPNAISPGPLETIFEIELENEMETTGFILELIIDPVEAIEIVDVELGERNAHIPSSWSWMEDFQVYRFLSFGLGFSIEPGDDAVLKIHTQATDFYDSVQVEITSMQISDSETHENLEVNYPEVCEFPIIGPEVYLYFGEHDPFQQTLEVWIQNDVTFYEGFSFVLYGLTITELIQGPDFYGSWMVQCSDEGYCFGFGLQPHMDPGNHLIGTVHYTETIAETICIDNPVYLIGWDWQQIGAVQTSECIPADPCTLQGDMNFDHIIDILDIIITVNIVLDSGYYHCVDLNPDGEIDVLDIVLLVNMIMGEG